MSKHTRRNKIKKWLRLAGDNEEQVKEENPVHTVQDKPKGFSGWYHYHYKTLLIIPILLLLFSVGQISYQVMKTGDFIEKDVSLKGGITITIPTKNQVDTLELQKFLSSQYKDASIDVRTLSEYGNNVGFIIESDISETQRKEFIKLIEDKTGISKADFSVEEMGGALSSNFFKQTLIAILIAFGFMSIVVFLYFKNAVPSGIVISCAFMDIISTLAIVNVLGIKLSTAGIAAFLMLIGYSVDTDILLTTRMLKRTELTMDERVNSSIITGLTMTFTTIAAVTVGLFFAISPALKQIMTIILIGMFTDIINTWITNVSLLRMYIEKNINSKKNVKN